MNNIRTIDLFAGCGGLTEGFAQTGLYETEACVEWEEAQCLNLRKRLKDKWGIEDANERVLRFDIQRTDELINGYSDPKFGDSKGLKHYVGNSTDLIIGGPPCQAYSIAGRVRDEYNMQNDYRNYLFESYLRVVNQFKPKAFVFENVPGLLSACPNGVRIPELIKKEFSNAGYTIIDNLKDAVIDVVDYGVPQHRKRIILLGLRDDCFGDRVDSIINEFYYSILPSFKSDKQLTIQDAIGDLPALYPLSVDSVEYGQKRSHTSCSDKVYNHTPRYHNARDIEIFRMLAADIEENRNQYTSIEARRRLYTEKTGKTSSIHKYNVLRWDAPSTTIPAHLCKDGLRHIHPDSKQARSITVREAARLQSFPDDYEFIGPYTDQYKMIGNAVPPEFARRLAIAVYKALFETKVR
jgi:DNA (cytosine-5)-methyltransferase 1